MPILWPTSRLAYGTADVGALHQAGRQVWEPGGPPPPVSAPINVGQGGDWITPGWGTTGHVICASTGTVLTALPPTIEFATNGTTYAWNPASTHTSAVPYPPGHPNYGSGTQACWYGSSGQDAWLRFAEAWTGTVRVYFLSKAVDARSQHVSLVLNGAEQNTFDLTGTDPARWFGAGEEVPPMLPGGRWLGWDLNLAAGDELKMSLTLLGGANTVFAAVTLDASGRR